MFRRDLIELLAGNPMTLREIARQSGASTDRTRDDLQHVIKSLRHSERRLFVRPAHCLSCGFDFSEEKLSKPSKCPNCRSARIAEPILEIR